MRAAPTSLNASRPWSLSIVLLVAGQAVLAAEGRAASPTPTETTSSVVVLLGDITEAMARTLELPTLPVSSLKTVGEGKLNVMPESRLEALFTRAREETANLAKTLALFADVQALFDRAPYPTEKMRKVAIAALCEIVMQGRGGGKRSLALEAARKLAVQFGQVDIDTARYPPSVERIIRAEHTRLEGRGLVTLTVNDPSVRPGTVVKLHSRGRLLGSGGLPLNVKLPPGEYSLWLQPPGRISALYPLRLAEGQPAVELVVNSGLDARVSFDGYLRLSCRSTESCAEDLRSVGRRLGVTTVAGVSLSYDKAEIIINRISVITGESELTRHARSEGDLRRLQAFPKFSPAYLLPLGGAQVYQGRYVPAAAYAAIQAGLGVWMAISRTRWQNAEKNGELGNRVRLRNQYNTSVGLLLGAVAASVAEGLIIGGLQGE